MKTQCSLIAGLLLSGAMVVGCEQRPEARPADRDTTPPPVTTTPRPGTTTGGTTGSGTMDQNVQTQANTLIARAREQINNNQFQAAQDSLRQLEQMKINLPQNLKDQVDDLRDELQQKQQQQPATTTPVTPATPE